MSEPPALRARLGLALLAAAGATRLCAAPALPLVLLALVAAWRVLRPLDRHALRLAPRGRALLLVLLAVLLALCVTWLRDVPVPGLGSPEGTAGLAALGTLALACMLALPQRGLVPGGTLALALSLVALASAVGDAPWHVLLPLATLPALALALQRGQAPSGTPGTPAAGRPRSPGGAWPASAVLAAGLGLLAWLALPPAPPRLSGRGPQGEGVPGTHEGSRAGAASGEASMGPSVDTADALLGAVDRLQADKRVHWEVRQVAGLEQPTLVLREAARELWIDPPGRGVPRWRARAEGARQWLAPDRTGWVQLGTARPGRATRMLEARARVPGRLLFLEPEALAFRRERLVGSGEDEGLEPWLDPVELLGSGRLRQAVLLGDVVRMRGQPQVQPAEVPASASSRGAPPECLALDPALAQALRGLCRDVVREGMPPIATARALEAWLQGPSFAYEASLPRLRPGRRVEDFLARVRRGNCEWYATALTLCLRAHGIAARYVTGYWGGSHTPGSSLWTFYGVNYHAWSEAWFESLGWVPLNPTPPERLALAADPRTAEASTGAGLVHEGEGGGAGLALRLRARLRGWLEGVGRAVTGAGPWGVLVLAGAGLLAALLLLGPARRARARATRAASLAARPLPPACVPYHDALQLLAARGWGRRPAQTAREHLAAVGEHLPLAARACLERLAAAHEQGCYAGVTSVPAGLAADLQALQAALPPTAAAHG